jgi:hypothetical protein
MSPGWRMSPSCQNAAMCFSPSPSMSKQSRATKCFSRSTACAAQINPPREFPDHCPICGSLAVREPGQVARRCVGLRILRAALEHDRDDLRNDVAGALHHNGVADADIFALDLVFVVQGGALHAIHVGRQGSLTPVAVLEPITEPSVPHTKSHAFPGIAEVEDDIAGLIDQSTHELRLAWRKLHRTGPPLGLSRDLMIRVLANKLQEHTHGGPSLALRRRLQTLAGDFEKGVLSCDPGVVLRTGATLVRQWRGYNHPSSFARTGSSTRASVIGR